MKDSDTGLMYIPEWMFNVPADHLWWSCPVPTNPQKEHEISDGPHCSDCGWDLA